MGGGGRGGGRGRVRAGAGGGGGEGGGGGGGSRVETAVGRGEQGSGAGGWGRGAGGEDEGLGGEGGGGAPRGGEGTRRRGGFGGRPLRESPGRPEGGSGGRGRFQEEGRGGVELRRGDRRRPRGTRGGGFFVGLLSQGGGEGLPDPGLGLPSWPGRPAEPEDPGRLLVIACGSGQGHVGPPTSPRGWWWRGVRDVPRGSTPRELSGGQAEGQVSLGGGYGSGGHRRGRTTAKNPAMRSSRSGVRIGTACTSAAPLASVSQSRSGKYTRC